MSILSNPYFHNEAAAFEHLEEALWKGEPVCPHCGSINNATKLQGQATRIGVWKCKDRHCRKQFTVKVGTVFEHGRIPLNKMLQAVHLMVSSKKGISAHQLHRILEIQYKSAWFLCHRIRLAMASGELSPLGGSGKTVEVDETYIGRLKGAPVKAGGSHKNVVVTLVERGGRARSFHVDTTRMGNVMPIVRANIAKESALMTDESGIYRRASQDFASHDFVTHSKDEYVRGTIHTNTVEGYYSIFKRGMKGVYQHCGEQHLHRYLAEFDFRYSNRVALGVDDSTRASLALKGATGKRLTYRRPDLAAE
ncbi:MULTISPECIES: IS1595 family transposase [unclassified Mesorhizobium]|uniref:IS1595 family transposase n=1 Tax=unclassified Mesorhizobium TaxID=325217 RepID=UPI000BB0860D|nr:MULTISPECIES: IS1595 family transposase [unclassified Mesorhizobium]PBC19685.1 IS1595 family transposase [Mesorhizobium sp. WSM4311]TRD02146.1 IS1595 family transposase [Mesorhizobium sp. WSM4305]